MTGGGSAIALGVTIDPTQVEGLDDVFTEAKHRQFDVTTRWHGATFDDPHAPALAFLRVKLPERGIEFDVAFVVDELRRSITAASITKTVLLLEPALALAVRTGDPIEQFEQHRWFGLEFDDVEPLVRLLEQRFDADDAEPAAEFVALDESNREQVVNGFLKGARGPTQYGVRPSIGSATIYIADEADDPELAALLASDEAPDVQGRWASMPAEAHSVVRFELLARELTRSWIIMDPDQRVVRAAASGPHEVAITQQRIDEDDQRLQRPALIIPMPAGSDAMKPLMR